MNNQMIEMDSVSDNNQLAKSSTPSKKQISYLNYSDRLSKSSDKKYEDNQDIEIGNLSMTESMNNSPEQKVKQNKANYNDFMILDQYDTYSNNFSPINKDSPKEEDSKVIEMLYKSKDISSSQHKTDDFEIAKILGAKQAQPDDKTYNSLLYFKTTEEGQQKMYDSYDYIDDLIKESKTCKFVPINTQNRKCK